MASRNISDCNHRLQLAWAKASADFQATHPATTVFLTCTYRSNEEQAALYALGRTIAGKKVTNAKAGQSKHNTLPSNAFDIAFLTNGKMDWSPELFKDFAEIVKPLGVDWGGDFKTFKDLPHFETK